MRFSDLYRRFGYMPVFLGKILYEEKRIKRATATKNFKQFKYEIEDGGIKNVSITLDDDYNIKDLKCNCRAFSQERVCSHIICGIIHLEEFKETDENFKKIEAKRALMSAYEGLNLKRSKELKLEVFLDLANGASNRYSRKLSLSLKIGLDKTYVVRSIGSLLDSLSDKSTIRYGNKFTLEPDSQHFNEIDQGIIDFLATSYYMDDGVYTSRDITYYKNAIRSVLERLRKKDFYLTAEAFGINKLRTVIIDGNPPGQLSLTEGEASYILKKDDVLTFSLTDDFSYIYYDGFIYKTTIDFIKRNGIFYKEFIEKNIQELEIEKKDLDLFVNKVLVNVSSVSKIDMDESLKDRIKINPLEAEFYIDFDGSKLVGDLVFKYGEYEFTLKEEGDTYDVAVLRDSEREAEIIEYLKDIGFTLRKGSLEIKNEDIIYGILSGETEVPDLDRLKIFYSEDVKRMNDVSRSKMKSVFSYNPGIDLLEINFQTEGLGDIDYTALFDSIKKKKKYFKLKTGDFISIDQDTQELLEDLYSNGDLDPKKFTAGDLKIPKYRSFYLDAFINSRKLDHMEENVDLKRLVESVKNGEEREYKLPTGITAELRSYQVSGYKWMKNLQEFGFAGILADEMGLGKTLQAICFIKSLTDEGAGTGLVVAPTSTLYNWLSEFERFAPSLKAVIVSGSVPEREKIISEYADVYITSYPLLRNDFNQYDEKVFSIIVADEAQFIKNHDSLTAKAIKKVRAKNRLALTGTPIENSLSELHSIFDFLMPGFLLSRKKFQELYEKPIVKEGDTKKTEKLKKQIKPFILRRLKRDVLKELPEKIEQDILIDLNDDQKALYLSYLSQVKGELEGDIEDQGFNKSRIKILAALTRLRQISIDPSTFIEGYEGGSAKIDALLELLDSIFEAGSRVLLFSSFTSVLKNIQKEFEKYGIEYKYLDGATPLKDRKNEIEAFNRGEGDIFLISLKAGGTGLNLTSADTVIHFDPWWNPQVENQATDRAHRIGQEKTVQVIRMIARGTIEERIKELQTFKKDLYDKIIEDGETLISKLSEEEIMSLFEMEEGKWKR